MQLDRKHFEEIYSRFLESGLTVKDFCSNEGLAPSKFYYWQKRVRPGMHPLVHNGFLPLSIDAPVTDCSDIPGMENQLEITYPGGITLRFRGYINVKEILTLLKPQ